MELTGRKRIFCRSRRPDFSLRLACYRPEGCCRRPRRPVPVTRVLFVGAEVDHDAVLAVRVSRAALLEVVEQVGEGRTILACPTVGGQEHVPPDWGTGRCCLSACGKVVWVSTRVAGRRGGVREVATVCQAHILASEEGC